MLAMLRVRCPLVVVISAALFGVAQPAWSFNTVLDDVLGATDDAYAQGRVVDEMGGDLATWMLTTTVSTTDFMNDGAMGGMQGIQYVMRNDMMASTDVNRIRFAVDTHARSFLQGIQISQSPYESFNGSWNGGNSEPAQFRLSWEGMEMEMARVSDPDDQILGMSDGAMIGSGMLFVFNDAIYNDVDSWLIELPAGVDTVEVEWSSANPTADSDLTREWVTFRPMIAVVPEPGTGVLACLALIGWGWEMVRRRR